ncbi:hypothetical protein [Breoghania sp.]|uniref:COG4223 family protein n=1 Tax=Breoghania sp. TaxID=2065378 RepID=UPI002AA8AABD|nr:hypothetical protein [Breoghania sp.]
MASEKDKTSTDNVKADDKSGVKPAEKAGGASGAAAKPAAKGADPKAPDAKASDAKAGEKRTGPSSSGKPAAKPSGAGAASGSAKADAPKANADKAGDAKSGASASSSSTGSSSSQAGRSSAASAAGAARTGKPLTIDLKAEEVRNKQASKEEAAKTGTASSAATQAGAKASQDAKSAKSAKGPEMKGADVKSSAGPTSGKEQLAADARRKPTPPPAKKGFGYGGLILAAGIGAAVAFGGVWAGAKTGYLIFETDQELASLKTALASADARFAALDERMREISSTEASPTVAPSVVNDLAERLQGLEKAAETTAALESDVQSVTSGLEELRRFVSSGGAGASAALASLDDSVEKIQGVLATLGEQVTALEEDTSPVVQKALDDIDQKITVLEARTTAATEAASAAAKAAAEGDSVAGNALKTFSSRLDLMVETVKQVRADFEGQVARLGTLEAAADAARTGLGDLTETQKGVEERVAALEDIMGGPGARETASRAVAVSLLKNAVDAGRSYTVELAAVRNALPEGTDFSALDAHAESGLKTITQLTREFPQVAAAMALTLERVDTGNSVADTFLNNMRSLVQVRSTGSGAGSGPMGALGQMEASVRAGNIDGALEIYETLPDGTQNAGKDWAASARARLAADALVDTVTSEVIEALAKDS